MMEEILEEYPVPRCEGRNRLRLVKDNSRLFTVYRIEVSSPLVEERPVELTFLAKGEMAVFKEELSDEEDLDY